MSPSRFSGLQKEVLQLYRQLLREALAKDRKSQPKQTMNDLFSTQSTTSYVRDEFRKQSASVRRSDFKTIEYKIRKGRKQLQLIKMPGVNLVGGTNN
eukprot:scaffold18584_cov79-Cyclotella_meneghiniana.AAC.11